MPSTADRTKETTTTTGTGNITLLGAVSQFQAFATAFALNARFMYCVADQSGTNWEVGEGYLSGSSTLVRENVRASSNAGAAVNFGAGTKDVFATATANSIQSGGQGRGLASDRGWAYP